MQEIISSIIVGGVQGVSEFLPISSSGHLVIIHNLFHWDESNRLAFDIALHFGTAVAIILYFWRDWIGIIAHGLGSKGKKNTNKDSATFHYPDNVLWQIIIASIPAAIAGFLLNDYAETKLGSPVIVAINLAVFGWLIWYIDKKSKSGLKSEALGYKQSLLIGLAQCIALVPGVSRSGITISAARAQGMDREASARFSFLLSTPAILGAFLLNFKHIKEISMGSAFWTGVLASTFFGFLAIKYLLQYLKRSDFAIFLWYRLVVAVIVLAIYLIR